MYHIMVHSKIIFYLLQDGCRLLDVSLSFDHITNMSSWEDDMSVDTVVASNLHHGSHGPLKEFGWYEVVSGLGGRFAAGM